MSHFLFEFFIEEYVQLGGEEIVDVEYIMAKLVDLAWGREIHLGLGLNEEPMEGNDVDNNQHQYSSILMPNTIKFFGGASFRVFSCRYVNGASLLTI